MNTKKPLSILLTLALVLGILPWSVMPAQADSAVPYIDANGEPQTISDAQPVTAA